MSEKNVIDFKKFKADREAALADQQAGRSDYAFETLCELLEKQDELLQMLIHDVVALGNECQRLNALIVNVGASTQAISIALEENNVLTIAAIQEVWERELLPALQQLEEQKKAQDKATESQIVVPKKPTIITP